MYIIANCSVTDKGKYGQSSMWNVIKCSVISRLATKKRAWYRNARRRKRRERERERERGGGGE